jgi:DNA-binding Lrp family transcriptional regulator
MKTADTCEKKLVAAISDGLDLNTNMPFLKIAEMLNTTEENVISGIRDLILDKKIKRFGPVVKNRNIGIDQNAMVTLKVSPALVDIFGEKISSYDFVTLCYERTTVPGVWEFNLYFMVHGKKRETVLTQIDQIKKDLNIAEHDIEVLFSSKCFKQKGASY